MNDPKVNTAVRRNHCKGPDFVDPKIGFWWDMTTFTKQWSAHTSQCIGPDAGTEIYPETSRF